MRNGAGDIYAGKSGTVTKSIIADTCDGVGDNGVHAAAYQLVRFGFDYRIAVIPTVIYSVIGIDSDTCKICTRFKSFIVDICDRFWDRDTGKTGTIDKSPIINSCDGVGDGDARKIPTVAKSFLFDPRDGISSRPYKKSPSVYAVAVTSALPAFTLKGTIPNTLNTRISAKMTDSIFLLLLIKASLFFAVIPLRKAFD